ASSRTPTSRRSSRSWACRIKSRRQSKANCSPARDRPLRGPLLRREVQRCDSQLPARADSQLGEDLAQMPLDRARTEEQSSAALCVGQPIAGEPSDVELLEG